MGNPFSTRHTRPGAIPFCFPPQVSGEQLVDRLRDCGWQGQIVGTHGSGKSTLLAALIPIIERAGKRTLLVELHDGQRRLPVDLGQAVKRPEETVVIVDGYEQLGHWSRHRLKQFCRSRGAGLVVTAHAGMGLPELYRTAADGETSWQIVELLLADATPLVTRRTARRASGRSRGEPARSAVRAV